MAAPINSVLPVITGTIAVGSVITLSNGTWDTAISYAYALLRSGVAITGATANTYTITRDDISNTLVGRVTATNADGSTIANSLATIAVPSTLIVETGSGAPDADSYITLAYVLDYHSKFGNASWSSITTDTLREGYIRKATGYMIQAYRQLWKGYRKTATQSLDWPRSFVYLEPFVHGAVGAYPYLVSDTIVPNEVKNACCELALKASTATLSPDLTQNVRKKSVGSISVEYDEYSKQGKRYEAVVNMLKPYINTGGASVQLVK